MKKIIWVSAIIAVILVIGGVYYQNTQEKNEPQVAGIETAREEQVVLVINDGENNPRNYDFNLEGGETVFDLLNRASMRENFVLETKEYDFGISIEAIGGKRGGEDNKYWIYYVNGEMGSVAVDQQVAQSGDQIEFRFEENNF